LAGALRKVPEHWVGRVASEGQAPVNPAVDRFAVIHRPAAVPPQRADAAAYVRACAGERVVKPIGAAPICLAAVERRGLEDRNGVEHLAVAQGILQKVTADAKVDNDADVPRAPVSRPADSFDRPCSPMSSRTHGWPKRKSSGPS
jgi:hypothetical protein